MEWIQDLSSPPGKPFYDVDGNPVPVATLDGLMDALDLQADCGKHQDRATDWCCAGPRCAPSRPRLRVFSARGDTDIDRFQESALFPGTPVAIAHQSRDGKWLWVVSPRYKAWVERQDIAEGSREQVLGYADKAPYRVVTGRQGVHRVHAASSRSCRELQLDMGVRVPLADVPPDTPVNGQHPYSSWTVELPIRSRRWLAGFRTGAAAEEPGHRRRTTCR